MCKNEISYKQKVEELKKNSQASFDKKKEEMLTHVEMKKPSKREERQKRKVCKPFRSEIKEECLNIRKKFISISVAFTEMELTLQVCIIIPILLMILLVYSQLLHH